MNEQDRPILPSVGGQISQGLQNPQMYVRMMLALFQNLASIITLPAEMVLLRTSFATQYFNPVVVTVSWLMTQPVLIFTLVYQGVRDQSAVITIALALAYYAACVFHFLRLRRLVFNMSLEKDSHKEGPALWFFSQLPNGDTWLRTRCLYEPLLLLVIAFLMALLGANIPALYFGMASVALATKNVARFMESWMYVRDLLDSKNRVPQIAEIARGKQSPDTVGPYVMAALPANRTQSAHMLAALSGLQHDYQALLTPIENSMKGEFANVPSA